MRTQNFVRLLLDQRFYLALLIVVSIVVGLTAIDLSDFDHFYQAGQALRGGVNPYTVAGFYSPLHVALIFAALSWLPLPIAFHLYAGLSYFAFGMAFYLLTHRIKTTVLLMCSPLPLWVAWYGNLEAWVLLGAALVPTLGIWLVMLKPQIGLVVALLFARQCWQETHSIYQVMRLALPVGVVMVISLMYGMWRTTPIDAAWNISLWPIGLIVGVPAAFIALYAQEVDAALFAGPFLSPYLGPGSWVAALPFLARNKWTAIMGVAASWGVLLIWRSRI